MPGKIKKQMVADAKAWTKKTFGKHADASASDASDFMQKEMAHARLGVLYLFGSGTYSDSSVASCAFEGIGGAAGSFIGLNGSVNGSAATKGVAGVIKSGAKGGVEYFKIREDKWNDVRKGKSAQELEATGKIEKAMNDLAKKVQEKVAEKLGANRDGLGTYVMIVKTIVANFVGLIVKEATGAAVPLSGFADLAKGVSEGGYAVVRKIDAAIVRRSVSWNTGGHTEVILDALERAMLQSAGEGLVKTLKGSLNIGLTFTTGSVAAGLSSLIIGIAEALYKIIWRVMEMQAIDEFIEDAKGYWAIHKVACFHEHADAFTSWFREYAMRAPVIAATTLNSGICGGTAHYLNLYSGDGKKDQQLQFTKGASYLARLSTFAQWYQKRTGVYFSSTNPHVKDILKAAKDRNAKLTGMEAETRKIVGVKNGQRVYDDKGKVKHTTPASFGSVMWDVATK